jgi:hypothetical protein
MAAALQAKSLERARQSPCLFQSSLL